MLTKIFHPNISHAGEICVNTLKKDWQSSYGIGHILITVKCLLIDPNPDSALDEEAGKLLQEDYDAYCQRVKLITSVHARTRPPEFDTPGSQTLPSTSSSSSSQNTAPTASTLESKPATKEPIKDSPAPLGTADSNVGGTKDVDVDTTKSSAASAPAATAMKRAATGTGLTGAEKRKKALKRL
jgi:ubiquitin-conjugating enzyme E2 S